MTVTKSATIRVTAKTDQAAGEFARLSMAQEKAAASLERYSKAARAENAKNRLDGFDKGIAGIAKNDQIMSSFSKTTSGLGVAFRSAALGAGAFVAVASAAAGAVGSLAQRGMEVQGVFNNLPFSIDLARTSTRGLITDFQLAKSANTLMSFGILKSSDDFAKLAQAAQALGQKLGLSAESTMESLSAALGRNSKLMLDNLGIILNETEAQKRYAATLGKSTAALTDDEKAQAFRTEAMKAVFAAAKNVKVSHDGAAASVVKLGVELDNLRDKALGAEQPTISLGEGMKRLNEAQRRSVGTARHYGASMNEVRWALHALGVPLEKLPEDYNVYEKALKSVVWWEKEHTQSITVKRDAVTQAIASIKAANATVGVLLRGERLKDIERELALLGDNAKARASVNNLLVEKAEITAFQLQLEGKLDEAEKVRFAEEIRVLRGLGETATRSSGGVKKMSAEMRFFNQQLIEAKNASAMKSPALSRGDDGFGAELAASKDGQIARSFADARKQQMIDLAAVEMRGQESMLEIKLQGIEREQAAGVDPWTLAQRERDARLFALQAQDEYVARTLQGQELLIAREEIAAQRRGVLHDAEMQRIARDVREREKQKQRMQVYGSAISNVHTGIAAAAIRGAFAQGQSVKDSVKHFAAGKAQEMTIIGATEAIQALVALAMFNYPLAAQHGVNSGLAFAQAGILGATYGVLGGGGGKRGGGGNQGASFGPGSLGDGGSGGGQSPRSGGIGQGPPISRPTGATPPPRADAPIRGSAPTINIYSMTGPDAAQMIQLRRALKNSERDDGEVN